MSTNALVPADRTVCIKYVKDGMVHRVLDAILKETRVQGHVRRGARTGSGPGMRWEIPSVRQLRERPRGDERAQQLSALC
jgi:hypothetical protein